MQREELENLSYSSFLPKSTNPELCLFMGFLITVITVKLSYFISSQIMSCCHVRKKKIEQEGMKQRRRKGLPKILSAPILFTHSSATRRWGPFILSNIALGLLFQQTSPSLGNSTRKATGLVWVRSLPIP